MRKDNDIDGT